MNYQQYFSNPSFQAFLLAAFFIYFIFRLFHFLNKRFVVKLKHRKNLRKFIYFIEFITWLFYVSESIKYFAEKNIVVAGLLTIILLVVVGWTAWFVIKDYVVGLYLKWNDTYKVNEIIEIDGQNGKIVKLGSRQAILEISPLHTINIAYSKLFSKKVIRTGLTDLGANASFTINVPKDTHNPENLNLIRKYIFQLPWTNFKNEPTVVVENQVNDKVVVRISASLIDDSYAEQFKNTIRNKFE
jgi:hypothetical protein